MDQPTILVLLIIVICQKSVYCQTRKEVKYVLSGRNMLEGKNLFFEINKDSSYYCRSESISYTENPIWSGTKCEVTFSGDTDQFLRVNIRDNIPAGIDDSLGWAILHVKNMLEEGETIFENVWRDDGNAYRGYITIKTEQVTLLGELGRTTNTTF